MFINIIRKYIDAYREAEKQFQKYDEDAHSGASLPHVVQRARELKRYYEGRMDTCRSIIEDLTGKDLALTLESIDGGVI